MKRLLFTSLYILLFLLPGAKAQKVLSFSLKEAEVYAEQNNFSVKNSNTDVEIARKMVKQNTAIGLPQISAGVTFNDYLHLPTSIIPNFLSFLDTTGNAPQTLELQFGLKYNLGAQATLNQLIYSGQYLVGLQTARAFLETAKQKNVKDHMSIRDQVAESYIGFLILEESITILDSTAITVDQLINEAKIAFQNGIIEDIDVDQLLLNKSNLDATIVSTKAQRLFAYNYLKFLLGISDDTQIRLTDDLKFFLGQLDHEFLMNNVFDYNYNIDYKLLQKQEYLVYMQYKLSKTAYQPTLSGFFTFAENAQRSEFNFFSTGSNALWFNTTNLGFTLAIPIWSSGSRKYAVDQARLNYEKMKVNDEQLRITLSLQVETARNDFNKSYLVFQAKQQGLETASRIYERTSLKYRKGLSTSTDLNQKYNQYLVSQGEYTQALFDLLKARIKLATLLEKV
jgi:outer membrane protein